MVRPPCWLMGPPTRLLHPRTLLRGMPLSGRLPSAHPCSSATRLHTPPATPWLTLLNLALLLPVPPPLHNPALLLPPSLPPHPLHTTPHPPSPVTSMNVPLMMSRWSRLRIASPRLKQLVEVTVVTRGARCRSHLLSLRCSWIWSACAQQKMMI